MATSGWACLAAGDDAWVTRPMSAAAAAATAAAAVELLPCAVSPPPAVTSLSVLCALLALPPDGRGGVDTFLALPVSPVVPPPPDVPAGEQGAAGDGRLPVLAV